MSTSTVDFSDLGARPVQASAGTDFSDLGGRPVNAPPQPTATMQAAPPRGVSGYLGDVERDLTEGGTRTFVGRGLGYLEGRGDQGYAGLESGVSPQQAQTMGSVPLGVAKVATGLAQIPSQPIGGALHAAGGALQAATLPLSFMAPEASEVATGLAKDAGSAIAGKVIPSVMKENAAGLLQSVAHDANKVPIQLNNAGDAALNLMNWQNKTQLGPTINKFLNRITNPKMGPLNYEDARDFYQLLGKMSADETMKMAPAVKRDLVQMVVGLKQDIGDAADQVGRAADYYKGMGDYAKAAKYEEWLGNAKDWAIKAGIGAAGAGGLYTAWKQIIK